MTIMTIEQSFIAGYTKMTLSSTTVCFGDNFGNNGDNLGDDNGHIPTYDSFWCLYLFQCRVYCQ